MPVTDIEATEIYHKLWHAVRGTRGRDRAERLTVLAEFLTDIGDVNLAARFHGFAKYPPSAYMPYTPWPLALPNRHRHDRY